MAEVTIIPAKERCVDIIRTAAYARVSSDSDDQLNSFSAQIRYYTEMLQNSQDAVLVDVYADSGITGTSAEKRNEFQRLMKDCRKGKIDRILTKSVSRFARNTKDCIEAIRELKKIGTTIYFEKEHIDTAELDNEMLLTLHSLFAQEESMSISKNVRMGIQKRMLDAVFVPNTVPYGYRKENKKLVVCKEEAETVKRIFNEYLSGKGLDDISRGLIKDKIPKSAKGNWGYRVISYILSNEKYIGDSKYHKWYTTDAMPFKCIENKGEKEMLYASCTHEAIIARDVFEKVQILQKQRSAGNVGRAVEDSPFRRKIYCHSCNVTFKRRKINERVCWTCRNHDKSAENCPIRPISDIEIKNAFISLHNKLTANYKIILTPALRQLQELSDKENSGNVQIAAVRKEIAGIKEQRRLLTGLKAQGILDAAYFASRSQELDRSLTQYQKQLHSMLGGDGDNEQLDGLKRLISIFESAVPIFEFDSDRFNQTVEKITAASETDLRFHLPGGLIFTEKIQRKERRRG